MTASDEEALPNARLEIATKGKAARETVRATMKVAREKEGQHRLVHSQRYKFLFLVMGLGTLFPYNMLLSCADYFLTLYPDNVGLMSKVVATNIAALVFTELIMLPVLHGDHFHDGTEKEKAAGILHSILYSHTARAWFALVCVFFVMSALSLLAALIDISFPVLIVSAFLLGILDALLQTSFFAFATSVDPILTAYVSSGSALAGLSSNFIRFGSKAMFDYDTIEGLGNGVAVSFAFAVALVVLCMAALYQASKLVAKDDQAAAEKLGVEEIYSFYLDKDEDELSIEKWYHHITRRPGLKIYFDKLAIVWKPVVSCLLGFFITMSMLDVSLGLSSQPDGRGPTLDSWFIITLLAMFNGGDFLGRLSIGIEWLGLTKLLLKKGDKADDDPKALRDGGLVNVNYMIWWPALFRWVFYPLVLLFALPTANPYLQSDVGIAFVLFFLGLTNGYIVAGTFVSATNMVEGEENQVVASNLVVFLGLFVGLMTGAFVGIGIEVAIDRYG